MNKNSFLEELYASFPGEIIPRRENFLMPVMIFVMGLLLLYACNKYVPEDQEVLMYSGFLLGTVTSIISLIVVIVRISNKRGCPYYVATQKPLKFIEMSFSKDQTSKVVDLVNAGNLPALRNMQQNPVSAVAVMIFVADNDQFVAMQAYSYTELDYHPLTPKIYTRK